MAKHLPKIEAVDGGETETEADDASARRRFRLPFGRDRDTAATATAPSAPAYREPIAPLPPEPLPSTPLPSPRRELPVGRLDAGDDELGIPMPPLPPLSEAPRPLPPVPEPAPAVTRPSPPAIRRPEPPKPAPRTPEPPPPTAQPSPQPAAPHPKPPALQIRAGQPVARQRPSPPAAQPATPPATPPAGTVPPPAQAPAPPQPAGPRARIRQQAVQAQPTPTQPQPSTAPEPPAAPQPPAAKRLPPRLRQQPPAAPSQPTSTPAQPPQATPPAARPAAAPQPPTPPGVPARTAPKPARPPQPPSAPIPPAAALPPPEIIPPQPRPAAAPQTPPPTADTPRPGAPHADASPGGAPTPDTGPHRGEGLGAADALLARAGQGGGGLPPPPRLNLPPLPGGGGRKPPPPPAGPAGPASMGAGGLPMRLGANGELASLKEATDLSNCLLPLLEALNWRSDPRHVAEALPHFVDSIDVTSFRNVMASLHYESRPVQIRLRKIDPRLFPCLFLPKSGDAFVPLSVEGGRVNVFDGGANAYKQIDRGNMQGVAYFFSRVSEDDLLPAAQKVGWFRAVTERFRGLAYQTLGLTLVLNILALVTPLFTMAVYDKVVATGSMSTLAYLAAGVGIAIAAEMVLRGVRARILAFIGARLDNIIGIAIFNKILFLPPAFTERATIGAQVARIKDFETVREFFTGPMALVLFELPFVVIFIFTIAMLGGPLVFISLIMMACFAILSLIITPLIRNSVSRAARASSKKQELTIETLGGMRAVKYTGAEMTWMERYRDLSATSALNSFYTAQFSSLLQTISHVLMISAGIGTVVFGVFRVLGGDMTVGALVASMILVWRVLSPLQTAFISLTRLTQVKSSINQINNLMNIRGEREAHSIVNPLRRMDGYVTFARVSIRYSPEADPALVGVSFDLQPGEVMAVVGGNGSGKSTVLKLLVGMYQPQAGSIRIDNMDIRQMDQVELRHAIAYVPQTMQFFYGTIAQNLRLAHPTATEDDLRWACEKAAVLNDVMSLEQGSGKWRRTGFDVRIGDSSSGQMPTSLLQRLNLARGYLKKAPIMLFDEPGNGLDFQGDQAFMRALEEFRGNSTILMVTHRPSHLKLADKMLWLEYGNVRAFGPADEILQQMPKDFI